MESQGRIQDFIGGGGWYEVRSPLRPGSRAHFRALEPFGFLMLFRAIWALFLSILIQNGMKDNVVDQILGGRLLHPLDPPLNNESNRRNSKE